MKKGSQTIPNFKITELKCQEDTHREFTVAQFEYFAQDIAHLYQPHRHDFYTLLLVMEGQGSHDIDFTTYAIVPDRLFFISPGQIHAWRSIDNVKGYILFFTDAFFSTRYNNNVLSEFPFFNSVQSEPYIQLSAQNSPYIRRITETLYCEFACQGLYAEHVIRSYLNVLLCELAREYLPLTPGRENSQRRMVVRNYENLINTHFHSLKQPKDYADLLYITPNYLNEVCKEVTGKSAGELIRKRIVIEAKRLLIHTTQTVSEVAWALNFEDASYFCRFFRKEAQLSPDRFRKTAHEGLV